MKILFAGGGTGGHLIAGISAAEEVRKRFRNADIMFCGTDKKFEEEYVLQRGFRFKKIHAKKWERSFKGVFAFLRTTFVGVIESLILHRKFKPDIVVGLGGYASFAPIIAAKLLSVPSLLLEQNVVPGKANLFLARWADEICCHWRASLKWFAKAKKVHVTGTPIRKGILSGRKMNFYEKFGLDFTKKTIIVTGGSQGAQAINEVILKSLPKLEQFSEEIQIIHCAGEHGYESVKKGYESTKINSFVCSFLNDMDAALNIADIVICRAGATTIAEITAIGIPAILIPYPYAADNHQYWNAIEVEKNGGGYLLQQIDLTPDKIVEIITDLLKNKEKYDRMKMFSKEMGLPNASVCVVDMISRLINYREIRLVLLTR
ncbi:MAG: undecaprenyldiphospho-muramoylpentapeptide beta-N-acetylglucosaminyltransferase [Planctomycetes bacterium]|nr:undecaprenyldiphospho-muramoylpentapeptide beta-N-acetylglucosaminyltransferase [Planctomycetota bacterium]